MTWTKSRVAVFAIGILHSVFMVGELIPWCRPGIMGLVLDSKNINNFGEAYCLLTSVVHNAGIYNGIVAAGLFATLWAGPSAYPVQVALLMGGIIAGVFGAATLAPPTILQTVLGAIALFVLIRYRE